jgi:hypothetical protein
MGEFKKVCPFVSSLLTAFSFARLRRWRRTRITTTVKVTPNRMYLLRLLFGDICATSARGERAPRNSDTDDVLNAFICFTSTVLDIDDDDDDENSKPPFRRAPSLPFEVAIRTTKSMPLETSTSVNFCRCVCDASGHVTMISNVLISPLI